MFYLPTHDLFPAEKGIKEYGFRFFIFSGKKLSGLNICDFSYSFGFRCKSIISIITVQFAGKVHVSEMKYNTYLFSHIIS